MVVANCNAECNAECMIHKIMMIMKLHDFLVVKTNDGEVVMKVHEHYSAGVRKNSPLKVVNTDVAGTPLTTYRETHCHSISAEKKG